jgi:hypothetical protein
LYGTHDSSMETGFYGYNIVHQDQVDPSYSESSASLTGKLQSHCPTLFSSLSVWEREVLNSSIWLKSVTYKSITYL